ncbi:MAG: isochorismatase [marine bacterium B5-7]|nr:MAG: isochorismatase [marine bacterium B5-7]
MSKGLILVDIQNDYFTDGAMELVDMEEAAKNSQELLSYFRAQKFPVFHIQHISNREGATFFLPDTRGSETHEWVEPQGNEPTVVKHYPSSFRETELENLLKAQGITELVVCGAMTHMCIDTTTRAAFDLGYKCQVISDACATRDLVFKNHKVSALDVNAAFMAALSVPFAQVLTTSEFVEQ